MKKSSIWASLFGIALITTAFGVYYHLTAAPPDLYNEVIQHTSAYERKFMVDSATPSERVKLWNRQIDEALKRDELTPEERVIVEASRGLLSVQAFRHEIEVPDLEKTIGDLFVRNGHRDLYRQIFIIPGVSVASDEITCKAAYDRAHPGVIASVFTHLKVGFVMPMAFMFQGGGDPMGTDDGWRPYCNCNWSPGCDSAYCGDGECRSTVENCGLFGLSPCYYLCVGS